jgi:hypothetical protein
MIKEIKLLIDYELEGEINDPKELEIIFVNEILSSIPTVIYVDDDADIVINSIEQIEEED